MLRTAYTYLNSISLPLSLSFQPHTKMHNVLYSGKSIINPLHPTETSSFNPIVTVETVSQYTRTLLNHPHKPFSVRSGLPRLPWPLRFNREPPKQSLVIKP